MLDLPWKALRYNDSSLGLKWACDTGAGLEREVQKSEEAVVDHTFEPSIK
jgi:hypothetical protein